MSPKPPQACWKEGAAHSHSFLSPASPIPHPNTEQDGRVATYQPDRPPQLAPCLSFAHLSSPTTLGRVLPQPAHQAEPPDPSTSLTGSEKQRGRFCHPASIHGQRGPSGKLEEGTGSAQGKGWGTWPASPLRGHWGLRQGGWHVFVPPGVAGPLPCLSPWSPQGDHDRGLLSCRVPGTGPGSPLKSWPQPSD